VLRAADDPDLVDEARAEDDALDNPEDANVIDGAALKTMRTEHVARRPAL